MNTDHSGSARLIAFVACALAVAVLAGCGGGGGTDAPAQVPSSGPPPPPPPAAPTISGTPPTQVTAGQAYSFTPTASGPTGMTLSFSVQNLPSWASFSIASGAVSGTPANSNAGTFANIIISVSDGQQSAALAPFSITVASAAPPPPPPPMTGSVTLSWTVPTTNTDGTPLTDLSGFYVNYGTSASTLTQTINVTSAATTGYTVTGLASGTWYFSVTAYTSVGTQSAPSNIASDTIG